jgi:hypothetical protein
MNPQLYPYFEWDARRICRRTGETTTCVYHEPWTGDAFWNIQVCNHCCSHLLFVDLIVLNGIIIVSNPAGCTSIMLHSLCRQDKLVLFWHSEGLSGGCTLCKSTCLNPEWQWYWWWACYWMATNCMFCGSECFDVLMSSLDPRNSRGHSEGRFCQIQTRSLASCISCCDCINY